MQGVAQLLRHLTPLVQQGNLVEQLEDLIDDKYTNEVSCRKQLIQDLKAHLSANYSHCHDMQDGVMVSIIMMQWFLIGVSCSCCHVIPSCVQ